MPGNNMDLTKDEHQEAHHSVVGSDKRPKHSLTQKELEYLCNRGGKNTSSYVGEYVDPDIEV